MFLKQESAIKYKCIVQVIVVIKVYSCHGVFKVIGRDTVLIVLTILCVLYRFEVDMTQFPIISRVAAECRKLEAFKAAEPDIQPDAPAQVK